MTTKRLVIQLGLTFLLLVAAVALLATPGNNEGRKPAELAPPAKLEDAPKPKCTCCGDTCKCTGGCNKK